MKYFILPVLMFILLVALGAAYAGTVSLIQTNIVRAGEARTGAETLSVRDASARSTEILLEETAAEREALAAFVVADADVVGPIAAVEDAGRVAGVRPSISGIAVVDLGLAHHEGVEVTLSATASYAALTRFAAVLESLPVAARLESLRLELADDAWFGTYRIVFVKEKTL